MPKIQTQRQPLLPRIPDSFIDVAQKRFFSDLLAVISEISRRSREDFDQTLTSWAGTINALTEKTAPVAGDIVMIEDSGASYIKKKVKFDNFINALSSDIVNLIYPVGSFYVQYPDANSNTASTAFPTEKGPASLFGGTWAAQWDTEAVFFRTQGGPVDTETDDRTNGLQTDQMQGHYHTFAGTYSQDGAGPQSPYTAYTMRDGYDSGTFSNTTEVKSPYTDGTNGTPRTGKETRGRNRLIKVWKRTA